MDVENLELLKTHIEELKRQVAENSNYINVMHTHFTNSLNQTQPAAREFYKEFYSQQQILACHPFDAKVDVHVYIKNQTGNYTPAVGHSMDLQPGCVQIDLVGAAEGYIVIRNVEHYPPPPPPQYSMPYPTHYNITPVDLVYTPTTKTPYDVLEDVDCDTISEDDPFDRAMDII